MNNLLNVTWQRVEEALPEDCMGVPVSTGAIYGVDPFLGKLLFFKKGLFPAIDIDDGYCPRDRRRLIVHPTTDMLKYPPAFTIMSSETKKFVIFYVVKQHEGPIFITDNLKIVIERCKTGYVYDVVRFTDAGEVPGLENRVYIIITDKEHLWAYHALRKTVILRAGVDADTEDKLVSSPHWHILVRAGKGWTGIDRTSDRSWILTIRAATFFMYLPHTIRRLDARIGFEDRILINEVESTLIGHQSPIFKDNRNLVFYMYDLRGNIIGYYIISVRGKGERRFFYDYELDVEEVTKLAEAGKDIIQYLIYKVDQKAREHQIMLATKDEQITQVKRLLEVHKDEYLTLQDSLDAGNCKPGTEAFVERFFGKEILAEGKIAIEAILKHDQVNKILRNSAFRQVVLHKYANELA